MIETLIPVKREEKAAEALLGNEFENSYNPKISIHIYRYLWSYGSDTEKYKKIHSKLTKLDNGKSASSSGKNPALELQHIEEEISHSESLKILEYDWDLQGAEPVDIKLYETAITFLRNYAEFLLTQKGIRIGAPEINLCRDSSIDLSWRTDKARMLINIRRLEQEIKAHYYGDLKNNNEPIKGHVPVNKIAKHLATWMENLAI